MDEIELTCKCGGELGARAVGDESALLCSDCGRWWPVIEEWMKPPAREFTGAQLAQIAILEEEDATRHRNCDGAPDGGHSPECRAWDES